MRASIIPIFIPHVGCPKDCVFCNQKRISGSLLPATAQDVRNSINSALKILPSGALPEVAFYGGSFTAIPEDEQIALLSAAFEFIKTNDISGLRVSTRPDCIDEKILNRLKKYGVKTIELGSQSMDDEVLRLTNRGHSADDTRVAAQLIQGAGVTLILQMMTGLVGSNFERDIYTAQEIAKLAPFGVRIYPTVIVKDTELADMWKNGQYCEHTVGDAVQVCAKIVPIFEQNGIEIIRIGLNPTEDLSENSALAGAYHPALGELVLSEIFLDKIRPELEKYRGADALQITVHKSRVSVMVGQKRANIQTIRREYGIKNIKIIGNADKKDEILLQMIAKK